MTTHARTRTSAAPKLVALCAFVLAAGAAAWMVRGKGLFSGEGSSRPFATSGTGEEGNASDPVDLISAIDLEVSVIDGASDLEVIEKDYDCEDCPIRSGKLEVSAVEGKPPRMMHNTYDDGSHCSFDETYYFALDQALIHAITLESCWEFAPGKAGQASPGADVPPVTVERWDETRTYFHEGRAIKSQRRNGAAREELDGTPWEDDVAPVGDTLPKRAKTLREFFDSDDDYVDFFDGRKPP